MHQRKPSGWTAFFRLWFVLEFSYVVIRLLFNLMVMGWIDLRRAFFLESAIVPFGQAVVFWFVTRRARTEGAADRLTRYGSTRDS